MAQGQRGWAQQATIVAGADLRTMQYKVIAMDGTISATSSTAVGILINKPNNGEFATVDWLGQMKGYAAVAITRGARLAVTTSGYLTPVTVSGSIPVGKAMEAANSGDLFTLLGDFATGATAAV